MNFLVEACILPGSILLRGGTHWLSVILMEGANSNFSHSGILMKHGMVLDLEQTKTFGAGGEGIRLSTFRQWIRESDPKRGLYFFSFNQTELNSAILKLAASYTGPKFGTQETIYGDKDLQRRVEFSPVFFAEIPGNVGAPDEFDLLQLFSYMYYNLPETEYDARRGGVCSMFVARMIALAIGYKDGFGNVVPLNRPYPGPEDLFRYFTGLGSSFEYELRHNSRFFSDGPDMPWVSLWSGYS